MSSMCFVLFRFYFYFWCKAFHLTVSPCSLQKLGRLDSLLRIYEKELTENTGEDQWPDDLRQLAELVELNGPTNFGQLVLDDSVFDLYSTLVAPKKNLKEPQFHHDPTRLSGWRTMEPTTMFEATSNSETPGAYDFEAVIKSFSPAVYKVEQGVAAPCHGVPEVYRKAKLLINAARATLDGLVSLTVDKELPLATKTRVKLRQIVCGFVGGTLACIKLFTDSELPRQPRESILFVDVNRPRSFQRYLAANVNLFSLQSECTLVGLNGYRVAVTFLAEELGLIDDLPQGEASDRNRKNGTKKERTA
eukprot:m.406843 g.406843  ORF g.406843 m.406843 type:complete len:305 (+) comp20136_c0_seq10:4194-5108(+)